MSWRRSAPRCSSRGKSSLRLGLMRQRWPFAAIGAGSSQHLGYMVRRDPDALLLKRGDHIAWANGLGQFAGRFSDQVGFTRLIAGGPSILPGFDGIQWTGVGLELQATRV